MSERAWFESYFGDDYLDIYADAFPADRTDAEAAGMIARLELAPGARVLDLACGHGRHALALARRGLDVTGFDLSDVFLARARDAAAAEGLSLRLVRGDMRLLPFDAEFDAVVNVFSAFGYFEDPADDLATLRGIRRALVPGGRFLLETLHRDGLPGRFQPRIEAETPNGSRVVHEYSWDLEHDVIHDQITLERADGTRARYETKVRMRSLRGLLALWREAGLEPLAWYGGLDGRPLELESRRLVLTSQRPA